MVLQSVLFGLASGIGLGISDLGAAAVTRRLGALRTAVACQLITVGVYSLFLLVGTGIGSIPGESWALLAGLSVLLVAFYVAFYKALQLGPVAVVGPVLAAHSIVIVLMAVALLGERLSWWQSVSVGATIGGVVLASVDLRKLGSGQRILGLGVALAIFASLAAGVWQYSIGAMSKELGWFLPLYVSRLFLLTLLTPLASVRRAWPWQGMTLPLGFAVFGVAMLESGSLFAFTRGAEVGIVSIVGAASTVYPVIPFLGGLYIFREKMAPSQGFGLCLVVAGLVGLAVLP